MGLENCQIRLDNPTATYFPGDRVSGHVEFNFNSVKKVRGIEVSFKGEAETRWTESESYRDANGKSATRTVTYSANERYFNIQYYILGGAGHHPVELPPGKHVYPLACVLPMVLPSSFEGSYGHVRYTVKVTLDRPWKFDQHLKAAFTVIAHLDINLHPRAREPATLTMEKYFCCLFCKSGPLTGILKVPCTGFVPGQTIPFSLEIDNITDVKIIDSKIKLKKIAKFYSRTPSRKTRSSENTIAELKIGRGVNGKESTTFNNNLTIPSLPPSNLSNCSIIDIDYELRITVEVEGMHKNMYGNIPIVIGTIPFANMIPMSAPIQANNVQTSEAPILGWIPAPPNTPPINPEFMPPPSYEECQFGTKSILDENDSEHTKFNNTAQWAPNYPVYHFTLNPPPSAMHPSMPSAMPPSMPSTMPSAMPPIPIPGAPNNPSAPPPM